MIDFDFVARMHLENENRQLEDLSRNLATRMEGLEKALRAFVVRCRDPYLDPTAWAESPEYLVAKLILEGVE